MADYAFGSNPPYELSLWPRPRKAGLSRPNRRAMGIAVLPDFVQGLKKKSQ
jgi:hypothetical protein